MPGDHECRVAPTIAATRFPAAQFKFSDAYAHALADSTPFDSRQVGPLYFNDFPTKNWSENLHANNGIGNESRKSPATKEPTEGFHWWPALGESLFFLGIENGTRLAFDPPSRQALRGRFWDDYVASVESIQSWGDGNPFFINYLGHPLQGSIAGFIQVQNDPRGRALQFEWSKPYWKSRMKAMAWSAAYSTYFEIGFPISEAALGNLGVDKTRGAQNGYVDLVVTPTLGTAWLVSEDFADRYWIVPYELKHHGKTGRALMRSFLNPTRSFANMLRFKVPWHRDGRPGVTRFDLPDHAESVSPGLAGQR